MKIDRMLSIVMLLLNREKISATELARIFDVSTRTIYRDVEAIDAAGIPIVSYTGVKGGIGIIEQYKVDKQLFTTSDITRILTAMSGIYPAITGGEASLTLEKLKGMIPNEQLSEIEFQANQIVVDFAEWPKDALISENYSFIKVAMQHKQALAFQYIEAGGKKSVYEIEPYRLLHKMNMWHLQGYSQAGKAFCSFELHRIASLRLTDTIFVPQKFQPSPLYECVGESSATVQVTIRFSASLKEYFQVFYGCDVNRPHGEDFCIATIHILDNEFGYNTLLVAGDKCECIEPQRIRKYLKEKIQQLSQLYSE